MNTNQFKDCRNKEIEKLTDYRRENDDDNDIVTDELNDNKKIIANHTYEYVE